MQHKVNLHIDENALVDNGEGTISFPNKLVITDDSEQRNGTRYDIPTMDLSEYNGQVTADHLDMIGAVVGKVIGLAKVGNKVVIDGIRFAIRENPIARTAYELIKSNFVTDFSIETYGSPPDDDGVYHNAKLIGLSVVVVGNNKTARLNQINQVVLNSIKQAKQDGLDTSEVENAFGVSSTDKGENMSKKEVKDEEVKQSATAQDDGEESQPDNGEQDNAKFLQSISEQIEKSVKPLSDKVEALEKSAFDKGAKEPEFKKSDKSTDNGGSQKAQYAGMSWEDRAVNQIESYRRFSKASDLGALKTLQDINEVNLSALKKEGVVKNDLTTGDLGNFVVSPEQLSEIQGHRSDYSGLVNRVNFRETLSTVTQWLQRSGDIDMTRVEYTDPVITSDDYLKPVSDYSATLKTMELEELAAVTPVANAATRFLAADILADVNQGYRTDYERKLAQLVVARLEQAVDANGNSETYNTDSDTNAVKDFANTVAAVAEEVPNGVLLMNHKSYWQFVSRATGAGISGPLSTLVNTGSQPNIFGVEVVVVPNDLLPTLNSAETVQHTVDGSAVTIDHSVFYFNPSNVVGRVSGGLQYDLSTDAAYEISGTVRSAFQRNQIVLRGAFFRGAQLGNTDFASGILSEGVS